MFTIIVCILFFGLFCAIVAMVNSQNEAVANLKINIPDDFLDKIDCGNVEPRERVIVYDVIYNSKSNHIDVIYSEDYTVFTSYFLADFPLEHLKLIEGSNPILIEEFQELEDYMIDALYSFGVDWEDPRQKEYYVCNMLGGIQEFNSYSDQIKAGCYHPIYHSNGNVTSWDAELNREMGTEPNNQINNDNTIDTSIDTTTDN